MHNELGQLLEAISFAAENHRNQRRKDHEASPYINHPIALATTEAEAQSEVCVSWNVGLRGDSRSRFLTRIAVSCFQVALPGSAEGPAAERFSRHNSKGDRPDPLPPHCATLSSRPLASGSAGSLTAHRLTAQRLGVHVDQRPAFVCTPSCEVNHCFADEER